MKFKPQYLMTIISVALMLYFAGLYSIISLQSDYFIDIVKERIDIMLELKDGLSAENRSAFIGELDSMDKIKKGSVRYISREVAKAEMEAEFGEDFLLEGMENPFSEVILFRLQAEYYNNVSLQKLKGKFSKREEVNTVSFQDDIFEPVQKNLNRIATIILIIGILLIGGAVILIRNTLKLSLTSQRKLIKTMELVGAKTSFILKPFMWQGFLQGLLSGILASCGIIGTLYALGEWIPAFQSIYTTDRTFIILGSTVFAGIVVFLLVTYLTVKRYLRIQMEDIF